MSAKSTVLIGKVGSSLELGGTPSAPFSRDANALVDVCVKVTWLNDGLQHVDITDSFSTLLPMFVVLDETQPGLCVLKSDRAVHKLLCAWQASETHDIVPISSTLIDVVEANDDAAPVFQATIQNYVISIVGGQLVYTPTRPIAGTSLWCKFRVLL